MHAVLALAFNCVRLSKHPRKIARTKSAGMTNTASYGPPNISHDLISYTTYDTDDCGAAHVLLCSGFILQICSAAMCSLIMVCLCSSAHQPRFKAASVPQPRLRLLIPALDPSQHATNVAAAAPGTPARSLHLVPQVPHQQQKPAPRPEPAGHAPEPRATRKCRGQSRRPGDPPTERAPSDFAGSCASAAPPPATAASRLRSRTN